VALSPVQMTTAVPHADFNMRAKAGGCCLSKALTRRRAEHLLSTLHDVPLKAVAMDCGFADQSHMTRLFKEKLSMTPKEYRDKRASGLFCSLTVQ
jgi:AraC-like DNA-binding protein